VPKLLPLSVRVCAQSTRPSHSNIARRRGLSQVATAYSNSMSISGYIRLEPPANISQSATSGSSKRPTAPLAGVPPKRRVNLLAARCVVSSTRFVPVRALCASLEEKRGGCVTYGNRFRGAVMISRRSSTCWNVMSLLPGQLRASRNSNGTAADLSADLPRIWRFALRLSGSGSVAEELVQRTWSYALENQLPQDACQVVSLMTILYSIWANDLGRPRVHVPWIDDIGSPDTTAIARCDTERVELFRRVVTIVDYLPEAERSVLLMVVVEGLKIQHAARVLGVGVKTAQTDLLRALGRVEEKLTE
jgi:RNA polymerase sigma-70 factor, ECF subfamily